MPSFPSVVTLQGKEEREKRGEREERGEKKVLATNMWASHGSHVGSACHVS
jgi:hypothetical protein